MDYKLAGFVSYDGISGGLRAVQTEKLTLSTLEVVPLVEAVVIPMVAQFLDAGVFHGQRNPYASGRRDVERTRPMGGRPQTVAPLIARGRFTVLYIRLDRAKPRLANVFFDPTAPVVRKRRWP